MMIHDQCPSSVIQGILSNREAGLMGSPTQVSSVVGIHWLHLISQTNKAESHWDLSTSTKIEAKRQSLRWTGQGKFTLPENALTLRCWRGRRPASGHIRTPSGD